MNTIHYTISASENTPRFGKPEPTEPRFSITVANEWTEFETPVNKRIKLFSKRLWTLTYRALNFTVRRTWKPMFRGRS